MEAVWASLPVSDTAKLRARLFPDMEWPSDDASWLTTEDHPTGGRIEFVQHIARGVFRATMLDRSVIVKFCTRNDTAMQQKCANANAAAHVLCDAYVLPVHSVLAVKGTRPVAWRIVVMEDLEYSMVRHRAAMIFSTPGASIDQAEACIRCAHFVRRLRAVSW